MRGIFARGVDSRNPLAHVRRNITRNRAFRGRQTDEETWLMAQISLTFPDGNSREFAAGITPTEVAAGISNSQAKKAISATVDGQHWDCLLYTSPSPRDS